METIILYLDDADYARPLLASVMDTPQAAQAHWVLVACAPRITHRVSKFVSNRSREHWRNKWADKLFAALRPVLAPAGSRVSTVLARVPLAELLESLKAEHGERVQVVDMRRPKSELLAEGVAPVAAPPALAPVLPAVPDAANSTVRRGGATLAGVLAMRGLLVEDALVV